MLRAWGAVWCRGWMMVARWRPGCRVRLATTAEAKAFVRRWRPSYFLFAWPKEKVTKEKGHPAWRLPPIHGRQVREPGPGFSSGHPARSKRRAHPWTRPLRGLSTPPHRRARDPGRAAGHRGPHSSEKPKQQPYGTFRTQTSQFFSDTEERLLEPVSVVCFRPKADIS